MRRYLSFGGGVNSTALYILLEYEGVGFEAVFADHGAEWPETYEHIEWMQANGHPVTVLEARRNGQLLYDYYWQHSMIPVRMLRHCTEHFKVRVLHSYFEEPCEELLGFDAGEAHRADRMDRPNISFPLVERDIDRKGCVRIIQGAGWPVPRKSGCYFCPFQRVGQWEELSVKHPGLLDKAVALEQRCNEALETKERPPLYLGGHDLPASIIASGRFARRLWRKQQKGQTNFWGMADREQCPYCRL